MKQLANTVYIILGCILLFTLYLWFFSTKPIVQATEKSINQEEEVPETTKKRNYNTQIPAYVIKVFETIEMSREAPDGYVGGRTFFNREKKLPRFDHQNQKITYQEWDVHRKVKGKSRGAERLVTGSDGRAYYTPDHYITFIELK